jgi:valyl-tRNA synthetase
MIERDIVSVGNLAMEATNAIRGFQSRFEVKVKNVRNWCNNNWQVELLLEISLDKMIGIKTDVYFDDRISILTASYPLVIQDHMFFIYTDTKIENYEDYILEQLKLAKKGVEVSQKKLSNTAFVDKAPIEIVNLEKKKLEDFSFKWQLWTKAFILFEPTLSPDFDY